MMTTQEAADRVGVQPHTLLKWQRDGLLTPESNGLNDKNRRINWSEKDVEKAIELKNERGDKTKPDALVEEVGGESFVHAYRQAKVYQTRLQPDELVVSGSHGCRIVKRRMSMESALCFSGSPAIILLPEKN